MNKNQTTMMGSIEENESIMVPGSPRRRLTDNSNNASLSSLGGFGLVQPPPPPTPNKSPTKRTINGVSARYQQQIIMNQSTSSSIGLLRESLLRDSYSSRQEVILINSKSKLSDLPLIISKDDEFDLFIDAMSSSCTSSDDGFGITQNHMSSSRSSGMNLYNSPVKKLKKKIKSTNMMTTITTDDNKNNNSNDTIHLDNNNNIRQRNRSIRGGDDEHKKPEIVQTKPSTDECRENSPTNDRFTMTSSNNKIKNVKHFNSSSLCDNNKDDKDNNNNTTIVSIKTDDDHTRRRRRSSLSMLVAYPEQPPPQQQLVTTRRLSSISKKAEDYIINCSQSALVSRKSDDDLTRRSRRRSSLSMYVACLEQEPQQEQQLVTTRRISSISKKAEDYITNCSSHSSVVVAYKQKRRSSLDNVNPIKYGIGSSTTRPIPKTNKKAVYRNPDDDNDDENDDDSNIKKNNAKPMKSFTRTGNTIDTIPATAPTPKTTKKSVYPDDDIDDIGNVDNTDKSIDINKEDDRDSTARNELRGRRRGRQRDRGDHVNDKDNDNPLSNEEQPAIQIKSPRRKMTLSPERNRTHQQSIQIESPRRTTTLSPERRNRSVVVEPTNGGGVDTDNITKNNNFKNFKNFKAVARGRSISPGPPVNRRNSRDRTTSPPMLATSQSDDYISTTTTNCRNSRDRTLSPPPLSSSKTDIYNSTNTTAARALSPGPSRPVRNIQTALNGSCSSNLSPYDKGYNEAPAKKKLEKLFHKRGDDDDDNHSVDETIQAFLQMRKKVTSGNRKMKTRHLSPKNPIGGGAINNYDTEPTNKSVQSRHASMTEIKGKKKDDTARMKSLGSMNFSSSMATLNHSHQMMNRKPPSFNDVNKNDNDLMQTTSTDTPTRISVMKSVMKELKTSEETTETIDSSEVLSIKKMKKVQFPNSIRYSSQYYEPVLLPVAGDDYICNVDFDNNPILNNDNYNSQSSSGTTNQNIVLKSDLYWSSFELQVIQKIAVRNAQKFSTNYTELIENITKNLEKHCHSESKENHHNQDPVPTTTTSLDDTNNQTASWIAMVCELKQKIDDTTATSSMNDDDDDESLRLSSSSSTTPLLTTGSVTTTNTQQSTDGNNYDNECDDQILLREWVQHPSNIRGLELLILKEVFSKRKEISASILTYYEQQRKKAPKNVKKSSSNNSNRLSITSSSSLSTSSCYFDQELLRQFSYQQTNQYSMIARYMAMSDALAVSSSQTDVQEND